METASYNYIKQLLINTPNDNFNQTLEVTRHDLKTVFKWLSYYLRKDGITINEDDSISYTTYSAIPYIIEQIFKVDHPTLDYINGNVTGTYNENNEQYTIIYNNENHILTTVYDKNKLDIDIRE